VNIPTKVAVLEDNVEKMLFPIAGVTTGTGISVTYKGWT
jgi:hypothetical protein